MQYTQEHVQWFQARVAQGISPEQAKAELDGFLQQQAAQQTAQQVAPVQAVQQVQTVQAPAGLAMVQGLAELAADGEDQTSTNGGGLPAAGLCHIRFKSYVEIGIHQPKNLTHKPGMVAIIVVELHTPQHRTTVNGVSVPTTLEIRIPKSNGKNSRWPKFVKSVQKALREQLGYDLTNMSQALGHACLGTIVHNEGYANLDDESGGWSFEPSKATNKITGAVEEVNIPPLHGEPQLFMFDNPKINSNPANIKWMWDSIFIDGTYTKKDEKTGVETTKSRNYYQMQIAKSQGWTTCTAYKVLKDLGCTVDFGETAPTVNNTTTVGVVQAPTVLPQSLPNAQASPQVSTSVAATAVTPVQPMVTAPNAGLGMLPIEQPMQPVATLQPMLQPAVQPVAKTVAPAVQPTLSVAAPQVMDASQFMNQFM